MADEQNREPTPEEKYGNKLPKQLQDQVDAVNAHMSGEPPEEEEGDGEGEEYEPEGEEGEGEEPSPDQQFQPPPEETWEQRARSALGRLDQALGANQQLTRRLGDLEREMNLMKVRGAEPPPPPQPKSKPQFLKPEEIADYGDEFFDVVGRKAREEFVPALETFDERIKRLESGQQAVGKVVEQSQTRGLYDTLHDEVPDWDTINHHPAFHNWLAVPDPYSGIQRHELLKSAFSRHDTDRVVNFFKGFLTEATGLPSNAPRQNGQSAPPLAPNGNGSGKPSLEDFAAPGRARSAPQHLPPDKSVYTHAQIARFYADKLAGKFRGRDDYVAATEADIFQAQHEGRIQ